MRRGPDRQWWWDGQRWRPYPGATRGKPRMGPWGLYRVVNFLIAVGILAVILAALVGILLWLR